MASSRLLKVNKIKKKKINQVNILENTRTPKMNLKIEMKTVVSNSFTHMVAPSMSEDQVKLFFQVVQSVSQQTDQSPPSTKVQRVVNLLFSVPCNSLAMSFLKKRIIKRFKKLFSTGY